MSTRRPRPQDFDPAPWHIAGMARSVSAALLVYRLREGSVEFLLGHPGGPFWRNRDEGAWSIPKGLADDGEALPAAAAREFEEEVGIAVGSPFIELTPRRLKSGKLIHCWLAAADLDLTPFRSNSFELEWPKGSGRRRAFPEIDRVAYLAPDEALKKIHPGQRPILLEALEKLASPPA